jgi:hypothetical protein
VAKPQKINPRWANQTVIVAASGPSLTKEVAAACEGQKAVVVNDAYRLMSLASVLYACDGEWWKAHGGCPDFPGERWSSHTVGGNGRHNNKLSAADAYRLNLVEGRDGEGFSLDPEFIHYGSNSGFQAVNLAILFGATRIILVGFDMRVVDGKRHFFGDHAAPLRNTPDYKPFIQAFERAAKKLPKHIQIINCTPQSALTCFPMKDLDAAVRS